MGVLATVAIIAGAYVATVLGATAVRESFRLRRKSLRLKKDLADIEKEKAQIDFYRSAINAFSKNFDVEAKAR